MTQGFARCLVLVAGCALLGAQPQAGAEGKGEPAGSGGRPQASSAAAPAPGAGVDTLPRSVMDEMSRATVPGSAHRELQALAGAWTTRTRVWEKPDARPLEFPGSAEYKAILGGRFLQLESRAKVNGIENRGLGFYGYDAHKEKYSYYYIHDGDTQALSGLGERDPATGAITFTVTMDMTVTGEVAKPIRAVMRRVSATRHVFEMYERYLDDREWKVLEITYDRAR